MLSDDRGDPRRTTSARLSVSILEMVQEVSSAQQSRKIWISPLKQREVGSVDVEGNSEEIALGAGDCEGRMVGRSERL